MRRFLIASAFVLAASPAIASGPVARMADQMAAACRADCLRQHPSRSASSATQPQACTLRCSAASSYAQIQQSQPRQAQWRGVPARPSATPARGGAMPSPAPAVARPTLAAAVAAPMSAHPVSAHPVSAQLVWAQLMPARPASAPPLAQSAAAGALHGVIFAARTPSAGHGLVVEQRDRMAAHRQAEEACRWNGAGCRAILEFTQACGPRG